MELNYKEGMFLGKQELERQRVLETCFEDSISRLIIGKEGYGASEGIEGLFAPQKLNYKLSKKTVNGVQGIAVSAFGLDESLSKLARLVVGKKNGIKIGVVQDSAFTGKECFLPLSEFLPSDPTSYDDAYFVFRLKPVVTNYEVSLISIDSNGVGTFSHPELVISLFREATGGRATKIKTERGSVLTVASINTDSNTVQFEGRNFVEESGARFMFIHTLSPYMIEDFQPLYTYNTCELICDGTGYSDWEEGFFQDDESVALGYALYNKNSGLQEPETPGSLTGTFLDTVSEGQITSDKLVSQAVTESKIANEAVTRSKLGLNAWGYRGLIQDSGDQNIDIYFEPGQIGFIYNEDNLFNGRLLVPRIPSGYTKEMVQLQPTKIVLLPNTRGTHEEELRFYFKTTDTGISLYFPDNIEGKLAGEFIYEVFEIFWTSLTSAVVNWTRIDTEP